MGAIPQLRNKAGKRVPSVSTIAKIYNPEIDGLLFWANRGGLDGKTIKELQQPSIDIGHVVHRMIDAHVKSVEPDLAEFPLEMIIKGERAFDAWKKWKQMVGLTIVATEQPLVSEILQYGGVLDCVGIIEQQYVVLDWKTTNSLREDLLLKIAAYGRLWNENNPDKLIKGYHLTRIGKEEGAIHHSSWEQLDTAMDIFQNLIKIHYNRARLKALL